MSTSRSHIIETGDALRPESREDASALGEQVSAKLAEIESALAGPGPRDAKLRQSVAELRALVDRQRAAQSTMAGGLEGQVADRTRELAALSNFLQTHNEREKALLARELHDALGGILTPAKMDLAWLEARLGDDPEFRDRMKRLSALIDQGIDLKRRIIEALRPSLLDHLGLASALQWYVDETCRDAKIDARMRISEKLERLSPDVEIALYRLVQECLNNVVKHARAKTFDLDIERTPEGLRVVAADDGVGIADLAKAKSLSYGIAGMMHRVRSMGGTFELGSDAGSGTRVEFFVPLRK
ncbi:MAG TPA: sensor histidine kinase [Usitatibacter sp.]|nr:sensor histidine kinase [Usitatibacter sp.]